MSRFALVMMCIAAFGFAACSSSSDSEDGDSSGDGDGDSSGGATTGGGSGGDGDGDDSSGSTGGGGMSTVSNEDDTDEVGDDLTLFFSPMYSAYDGMHDFKVPAIVQGVTGVRWSANPADAVDLEPDSSTGGVLITTRKPGQVKIIARASNGLLSGSADLFITDATPDDWELGNQRYNNEIEFPEYDFDVPDGGFMIPDGGFGDGGFMPPDGGFTDNNGMSFMIPDDLSCRNCHGSGATALDVEHTPQQTGGYSDEELIQIFTMGMKPEGAQFHTPFPEALYVRFHTWEASDAEKKGIVTYLRWLTPKSQGPLDFQGLMDAFTGGGN